MKNQIEKAIIETLVIENKQSVHIAVDKILSIVNDQWISVDERLPEVGQMVLYIKENMNEPNVAYYKKTFRGNSEVLRFRNLMLGNVIPTHWMPLPPAPKQKTKTT